jgi:hypothetical protein
MNQLSTHTTATSTLIGALELNHLATTLEDGALEAAVYAGPTPNPYRTIHGFTPGCISDGMLEAAADVHANPPMGNHPRTLHGLQPGC